MSKQIINKDAKTAGPNTVSAVGDYLNRKQVLKVLGIKQQTLYAYVSRGLIRSVPQPDGRTSYYSRQDVLRMHAKSAARSGCAPVAASAMRWGEPVLETSITEITDRGPSYRGQLATNLAQGNYPFENVAELLWCGTLAREPVCWRNRSLPARFPALLRESAALNDRARFLQLLAAATVALGIAEGSRRDRVLAGSTPVETATRLIPALVGVFGFLGRYAAYVKLRECEPIAQAIIRVLGRRSSNWNANALNATLVLVADHELNPATFAARIAASCGADLHSCVGAAINTQYGSQIGCACDRVERMFAPGSTVKDVMIEATQLRAAGRKLPGFDHQLYPAGDPRARMLIDIAKSIDRSKIEAMLEALMMLECEFGARPSVEAGLVFVCRALGFPDGAATGLYALGRSAGWIAHVMEQRDAAFMIRPRAKFAMTNDLAL